MLTDIIIPSFSFLIFINCYKNHLHEILFYVHFQSSLDLAYKLLSTYYIEIHVFIVQII